MSDPRTTSSSRSSPKTEEAKTASTSGRSAITRTDLRGITRNAERVLGIVVLHCPRTVDRRAREVPWLVFGEGSLDPCAKHHRLEARMTYGVTDSEGSSAFAFILPLIGVRLEGVQDGIVTIKAYVDPNDPDGFHVPRPGYDPTQLPDVRSEEIHGQRRVIVPEGYWFPPEDRALFRAVAGIPVEIKLGAASPDRSLASFGVDE